MALDDRLAFLDAPPVAPLNEFVRRLRTSTGHSAPWFDPYDGGTAARLLILMESPSRKGHQNGFVSVDNDTPTGRRMRNAFAAAGLTRDAWTIWNVVPWYLGDDRRARNPTLRERREGEVWLAELLPLLPNLRAVLTLGAPAREGWRALGSDLPHFAAPHPSNTNFCARPWLEAEFERAVGEAAAAIAKD